VVVGKGASNLQVVEEQVPMPPPSVLEQRGWEGQSIRDEEGDIGSANVMSERRNRVPIIEETTSGLYEVEKDEVLAKIMNVMTRRPGMVLGTTKGFPYKGFSDVKYMKLSKNSKLHATTADPSYATFSSQFL
jgi:hypothetical protein